MGNDTNKMLTCYKTCKTGSRLMAIGVLFLFSMSFGDIVVSDGFTDGGRTNGADAKDVNWWKIDEGTAGNVTLTVKTDDGAPGIGGGNALEAIHATDARHALLGDFDDGREVTLSGVNQFITLKFDFRILNATIPGSETDFRFGLFNNMDTLVSGDQLVSGNAGDDLGYMVRASTGTAARWTLTQRTGGSSFMGGTVPSVAENTAFGGLNDNNRHTVRLTITRNLSGAAEFEVVLDEGTAGEKSLSGTNSTGPFFTFNEIGFSSNDDKINYIIDNVVVETGEFIPPVVPVVDAGADAYVWLTDAGAVDLTGIIVNYDPLESYTYTWSDVKGQVTFTDTYPASNTNANCPATAGFPETGLYILTLDVTNSQGSDSDTVTVKILDPYVTNHVTIFDDSFEDCLDQWNTNAGCSTGDYYHGLRSCQMNSSDYAETAVDTTGFSTILVSYVRKTSGLSTGNSFVSEWYDGTTWNTIETMTSGFADWTWVSRVELPASAGGNADFKLRFRVSSGSNFAYVDAVTVEGVITCCAGSSDFDCDGIVDVDDLSYMAGAWLTSDIKADIARPADTLVNLLDLSVLAEAWLISPCSDNINTPPNILMIIVDQQFADVMSCHAGTTWLNTPGMDSIAQEGVRFTNAYANYPVCLPHRYSMFTGRLACTRKDADLNNKPVISLGNQTKQAGYDTAFFGKWHIQDDTFNRTDIANTGFDINMNGLDISMTDDAIEYFKRPTAKPFFAVVSYYNPHDICEWGRIKSGYTDTMANGYVDINPPLSGCPPLPDNYAINADEAEAVTVRRSLYDSDGTPNAQLMAMSWTEDTWRQYRWAYHRLVELVDLQIARLLQSLKDNGLDKNTIIIFTSDHGDGYGAHRWHQKSVLYEESCRVPFIIRYPDSAARKNQTDDRLISVGIDLMPTISDIVGVDMPEGPYYGKSALPFVFDENSTASTHEYVVTEAEVDPDTGADYQGRSVRTAQYKYHRWSYGANREQLFDMINDPGETTNLADNPAYAWQLQHHRDLFADWLSATDDTYTEN